MTNPEIKGKIAFFYTDGGVRPTNPGFGGTGVHGYVFSEVSKKPEIIANQFGVYGNRNEGKNVVPKATPTTKGYRTCEKDGDAGRDVEWVKPTHYLDASTSFSEPVTNNYAELYGILQSLQFALEIEGLEEMTVCADSQYALDCVFLHSKGWVANNWISSLKQPVANKETIQDILEVMERVKAKGIKVFQMKVKGHSDDIGNNSADYLATMSVYRSMYREIGSLVTWSPHKGYWEGDVDRHPMLHGRRFLYNRVLGQTLSTEMFMIEPGGTDLTIGKRDHEGYALVRLNKPCPAYETLLKAQSRYNQHENWPMIVTSDRLYNKFIQRFATRGGQYAFTPNARGGGLYFMDGGPVAIEHNPPLLIYRTLEAYNNLKERLEEYLTKTGEFDHLDFPEEYYGISGIDLTNDFFDVVEKKVGKETVLKKVLKPSIEVGYTNHLVTIDLTIGSKQVQRTLPLALGMDLPLRNSLKKLEGEDPQITLITWRAAPGSFQYGCVVECLSGVGIWSNYYCDRFFV